MHKPPGYYKDEKNREYYWDGERRSYILKSSWTRFNEDMEPLLWTYFGAVGLVWLLVLGLFGLPMLYAYPGGVKE